MFAQIPVLPNVVSIVPRTGIQFLDFGFNAANIRVSRRYWERPMPEAEADRFRLIALSLDPDTGEHLAPDGKKPPEGETFSVNADKALGTFNGVWLPVPLFRVLDTAADGAIHFSDGPENWARVRVVELPKPDLSGNTHRITLALDTKPIERKENWPYVAPTPDDIVSGHEFALACNPETISWLVNKPWLDGWIKDAVQAVKVRQRGGRRATGDDAFKCDHIARYLVFIELLDALRCFPRIRFIDTETRPSRYVPINVDLVLDIGNSRSYGMLVESIPNEQVDMNNSYPLELRDLQEPQFVYSEPFPSRVEFHQASFGDNMMSRRSGRNDAFNWPIISRVGFEAVRLSYGAKGTEGATGLSSPKRYLWDTTARIHEWRFARSADQATGAEAPVTSGAFVQFLREDGEERENRDLPPVSAKFSRSSIMTFYLCEVLFQAFSLINSVTKRYQHSHADVPRRIKRLVLTIPTAMPLAERRIFLKRVSSARNLVWNLLGLEQADAPEVLVQWDESTGTQVVFLYNEVKRNFHGDVGHFFQTCGRNRERYGDVPCLRVASIDIGGGTTDLIVTTYELEGGAAIRPHQEFREGFNLAGDDVLCSIIERDVLPILMEAVKSSGVSDAAGLMANLFGDDRAGQLEQAKTLRKQFANQILIPIGLHVVRLYEQFDMSMGDIIHRLEYSDVFDKNPQPSEAVIAYLEQAVADMGGKDFRLANVVFNVSMLAVDNTTQRTFGQMLADLSEVIHLYDCDYLLLSGRPSRLPAVRSTLLAKLPVTADRIIPMHRYLVSRWYPFRDLQSRLSDPKTTAAVGAMVCALSEGQLDGFHLRSRDLEVKSTARYVGEMGQTNQIQAAKVFFANVDLEDRKRRVPDHTFDFYAPTFIGFRQLNAERWPATPLYRVDFGNPDNAKKLALPLKVTLERVMDDSDEDFRVAEVSDSNGDSLGPKAINLRLQTLRREYGYWIDTGIFSTPK